MRFRTPAQARQGRPPTLPDLPEQVPEEMAREREEGSMTLEEFDVELNRQAAKADKVENYFLVHGLLPDSGINRLKSNIKMMRMWWDKQQLNPAISPRRN
jgi:hypothetical protein